MKDMEFYVKSAINHTMAFLIRIIAPTSELSLPRTRSPNRFMPMSCVIHDLYSLALSNSDQFEKPTSSARAGISATDPVGIPARQPDSGILMILSYFYFIFLFLSPTHFELKSLACRFLVMEGNLTRKPSSSLVMTTWQPRRLVSVRPKARSSISFSSSSGSGIRS